MHRIAVLTPGPEDRRPLDAYEQTVELASNQQLVIASGYTYAGGVDFARMTDTPLTKATPRGSLTWSR